MAPTRILVVEDDELVRSFLCHAIASVCTTVDTCATGAEARAAVERTGYGVILLDGLLPDVHGVELAQELITNPRSASAGICFVSGTLRRADAPRAGIAALPKPLRVSELVNVVRALLAWHESPAESPPQRLAALEPLRAALLVR